MIVPPRWFALVCWLFTFPCCAETLQQLLVSQSIPVREFSRSELLNQVQGSAGSDPERTVVAYRRTSDRQFVGPLLVVSYSKVAGVVHRSTVNIAENDVCQGSPQAILFVGRYVLLSISLNPSAACLFVIGPDAEVQHVFYGFSTVQVEPGRVVLLENLRHFAPVHPERLQWADLATGQTRELYPALKDPLRSRLIAKHRRKMPPRKVCMLMNDPCGARQFDESIDGLQTDGKGRFAFVAEQSANHATAAGVPPSSVASQEVLYVYQGASTGWRFCEVALNAGQVQAVKELLQSDFARAARRCTPAIAVVPDMSTAESNPFFHP